jgi:hypothetical protein
MNSLSGKKLPAVIAGQHENCATRLDAAERTRDEQARKNRQRFYGAVALLILWYVGGPFAGGPPFHFVVQAIGVLLVAFGVGVLRALQSFVDLRAQLASVRLELLNLEGEYGIDFASGTGNPPEIAAKMTPTVVEQLKRQYSALSGQLTSVEGEVEKSLFAIYLDLFSALKTGPKEPEKPAPVPQPIPKQP